MFKKGDRVEIRGYGRGTVYSVLLGGGRANVILDREPEYWYAFSTAQLVLVGPLDLIVEELGRNP